MHHTCTLGQVVVLVVLQYSTGCVVTAFFCILSLNEYKGWGFLVIFLVGINYQDLLTLIG